MPEASGYTIRDARPDELDAAAEVMRQAYTEYSAVIPPNVWERYQQDIVNVRSRLATSQLIVAVEGDDILGCLTFYPDGSKGGEWPSNYCGLRLLAVPPDTRGHGVGRALMEESIRRAKALGAEYLGLHTTELMAVARSMYERMGFERIPEFDFHPAPGIVVTAYRLGLR